METQAFSQDITNPQIPKNVPTQDWAPIDNLTCTGAEIAICKALGCHVEFDPNTNYEGVPRPKDGRRREFCGKACKNVQRHRERDAERKLNRNATTEQKNKEFRANHRDHFWDFDPRYVGPGTSSSLALPEPKPIPRGHDVHVRPVPVKFVDGVTTHQEGEAQQWRPGFAHSKPMPRSYNSFCTQCTEVVIVETNTYEFGNPRLGIESTTHRVVRESKGVYLPVDHDCPRVRVYDLQGKLLEVK